MNTSEKRANTLEGRVVSDKMNKTVTVLIERQVKHGMLTARQIEAARRAISRHVKRGGKLFIRVFPDKPITKKPIEVRMGSGKGGVEFWAAVIQPGRMIYEIEGVPDEAAREAFPLAAAKWPNKATFVTRTVL